MTIALYLLLVQGVLGAWDTVWYHELTVALPGNSAARRELRLHATRDFVYTVVFGTLGLGYFMVNHVSFQSWYYQTLFVLLIITLIIGALVFGYRLSLTKYLERFGLFRKIEPYLIVIDQYEFSEIREAMFWATLRYTVFSIQFWLLFQLFNIKLNVIDSFAGIFLVFFSKTLIPAINFLGDLGIREASSLFVFGVYNIEPSLLIATTLSLWCVNIFIPTVVGIFWALKLKF